LQEGQQVGVDRLGLGGRAGAAISSSRPHAGSPSSASAWFIALAATSLVRSTIRSTSAHVRFVEVFRRQQDRHDVQVDLVDQSQLEKLTARAPNVMTTSTASSSDTHRLAGDDPIRPSYLLWTTIHGVTSIELTHAVRSALPGWFIDSPEAGEQILLEAVRAVLTGLH
jgi:hypothetical protein